MAISRIIERLQNYPHVSYTTRDGYLEVPAQGPTGFLVYVQQSDADFIVGFEGWHEHFAEADAALNCFSFGLSTACRLRVSTCLGMDHKWQVLSQDGDTWVVQGEVGLLFPTLFLPKTTRDLRNDLITV